MSDVQEGPGYWLASDGKWYAPELAPAARQTQSTTPARESSRSPLAKVGLANYPQRLIASAVDIALVWGLGLAFVRSVLGVNIFVLSIAGGDLLPFFFQLIYLIVVTGLLGGTIGNVLVGTKIIDSTTGSRLNWARVSLRSVSFIFLEVLLFFGLFTVAILMVTLLLHPASLSLLFFGLPALIPGVANAVWPLLDRRAQAWHDKAADCLVVKRS